MYGLVLRIAILFLRENTQNALGITAQASQRIPLLASIQRYFTQKSDFSRYTNLAGFEKIDSISNTFQSQWKTHATPTSRH